MFDRSDPSVMLRNGGMSGDDIQFKLRVALDRALKAEKAFLSLKLQNYKEKMDNEIKIAEQECVTKMNLYNSLPDQVARIHEEFKSKTAVFQQLISRAMEVHTLCMTGLDQGLSMEELPVLDQNQTPLDFRNLIFAKIKDKQDSGRGGLTTNGESPGPPPTSLQNGIANGSRNGSQPNLLQPAQATTTPTMESNPLPMNSTPSGAPVVTQQSAPPHHGAIGQPVPAAAAPQGQINQNMASDQSYGMQIQHQQQQQLPFGQHKAAAPLRQSVVMPTQSREPQVMDNKVQQIAKPAPTMNQQQSHLNNLSAVAPISAYTTAGVIPETVRSKLAQNGAAAGSGMGIGELDDFVLDDDMFQSSEQLNNVGDNRHLSAGVREDTLADTDQSSDGDDEEFARNLVQRQGAKSKAAKSLDAGKPKQVVEAVKQKQNVSAKPAAKSAAKATARQKTTTPPPSESDSQKHHQSKSEDRVAEAKKLDPADEINWKEEPFLTIVTNLAGTYRVNKKVAQESLEAAVRKMGGVEQLDAVWAEAEKIVKQALKPSPLQPKAPAQSAASSQKAAAAPAAAAAAPPSSVPAAAAAASKYNPFKTSLCKEYMETKKCKHGEYCLYAHGEKELKNTTEEASGGASNSPSPFYKVIMCRNYTAGTPCRWGDNCIFAHGDRELRKPGTQGYSEPPRPQQPLTNNPVHPEPCDNQQCPAKLEYLLRKTAFCEMNKKGQCIYGKECKFAHSRKEVKPMPKWEICFRSTKGKCQHMNNPERCVYAHSQRELRKKPAEYDTASKPAVNTGSGGRLIMPGRKYIPWAGNDQHPPTPDDADECQICYGPLLTKKNLLKCGHNQFHEICISQWVNEGVPSCPICREPAKLPDLYKAPAGFKAEEFPGLGL